MLFNFFKMLAVAKLQFSTANIPGKPPDGKTRAYCKTPISFATASIISK
jgi:hypothetical protein